LLRSSLQNQKNADLERSCEIMLISALYLSYDSDLCWMCNWVTPQWCFFMKPGKGPQTGRYFATAAL
jgi:hypothetical protein